MEQRESAATGRRIALLVQYDGSAYNGWQVQSGGITVQGEIERALEVLTREKIRVVASGRTAAGVHARGQVAHFTTSSALGLQRLCIGLNGILGWDIAIKNAYNVPGDFHARYSAVSREYVYLIYNHKQRNPFMRYRAMWVNYRLDVESMREAASHLIGEKDFKSFCKKISAEEKTVRRIDEIDITGNDELISIRIRGNAFLHNMIRIIVGTLCDMCKNNMPPSHMREILDMRDRDFGGITAPPYGLYLNRVTFDPPLEGMESAF